jgi:hypothetical protein
MRNRVALVGIGAAVCVLASLPTTAQASSHIHLAKAGPTVDFEMDEPVGSTVMTDSVGGVNGAIASSPEITTGVAFDGATGYQWTRRPPNQPPAVPEHVIQVPDNPALEPGSNYTSFTVEIRYRTKENFGNITQKGQSASRGGQWKIQNPQGMPSCLFKDGTGARVATRVKSPINDNQWHTLTCVLTRTRVTALVDGVEVNHKNGSIGTVDNSIPMTVGGKINCNQSTITCDYFSGMIDYIRITKE